MLFGNFAETASKSFFCKVLGSNLNLRITPDVIHEWNRLQEFFFNVKLSPELKMYRPQRRPEVNKGLDAQEMTEKARRKRRLIVRDWLYLAVWYVRLRKLLKNHYSESVLRQKLFSDPTEYADLIEATKGGVHSVRAYLSEKESKIKRGIFSTPESQRPFWDHINFVIKLEEVKVALMPSDSRLGKPILEGECKMFAFE